jgi:hypothetical protein
MKIGLIGGYCGRGVATAFVGIILVSVAFVATAHSLLSCACGL